MTATDLDGATWSPFRLEDRDLLAHRFRASGHPLCEFTFATQFCWQGWNDSRWCLVDDFVFVHYREGNAERMLCPFGPGEALPALEAAARFLADRGFEARVDFVPARVAENPSIRKTFRAQEDRNNADYWHLRTDLADLSGRRFADKRNLVAQFLRSTPNWRLETLEASAIPEVAAFVEEWCRSHNDCEDPRLAYEVLAMLRCLDHWEGLGQRGFVLRIGERIGGLVLGEEISDNAFVVHYEKALSEIRGVYALLVRETARALPVHIQWIDREQDMGHQGLRHNKQSWNPHHLEPAFTLSPL